MRGRRATTGPGRVTDPAVLDEVRTRLLVGAPPRQVDGLPPRASRAIEVALRVGAPAVPALDAALAARADDLRIERGLSVATAQARTVAVGLIALPFVAVVGLGSLLGLDLWTFYTSPAGSLVGLAGAVLTGLGAVVSWRIVARAGRRARPASSHVAAGLVAAALLAVVGPVPAAVVGLAVYGWQRRRPRDVTPPGTDEVADLLATAVAGGYGTAAALRVVADALPAHAGDLRRAALAVDLGESPALPVGYERIAAILRASARWGAPVGPPLRSVASELRADDLARSLAAAERLPALLAFPTALCLLPACVLLVGAPLVAEGIRAASGS